MNSENMTRGIFHRALAVFAALALGGPVCSAVTLEELAVKLERLEAENRVLREEFARLIAAQAQTAVQEAKAAAPAAVPVAALAGGQAVAPAGRTSNVVTFDHTYSYQVLDPTTNINRKQQLILAARKNGELAEDSLTLGGAITAVADHQTASKNGNFGYLMRQPGNQVGQKASEAVIHSAQVGVTGTLGPWLTAFSEILYSPQQSFSSGSNTSESRNQLQLRQGYVLLGNLERSPFYLSIGKMATPFGLTDTVSPFSASTVWHAFGGLANGIQGGYSKDGLNLSVMAVQGGAQFRGANTPVNGTNIPSKLNNYVANASYTLDLGSTGARLLVGGSYERGSAYCQGFPVSHFGACANNNPAYDFYGQLKTGNWVLQAEFAKTTDVWPGTFNPALSQFDASKVSSFGLGAKYRANILDRGLYFSADFSRFRTGPDGSPWERQDQAVFGIAGFLVPSVKLFAEYVHINGFVPLPSVGRSSADSDAKSKVVLIGVNAAY